MKKLLAIFVFSSLLAGCSSPPKPPLPTGEWVPVNSVDVGQVK